MSSSAVSRRHCRIVPEVDGYRLEDLDSHNGTFVNNLPVRSRSLVNGDRISIGDSCVVFLTTETEPVSLSSIELDDGSLIAKSFIQLLPQLDTVDFSSDLGTLAKFGTALANIRDPDALKIRFLELILEIVPARIGVIAIRSGASDDLDSVSVSAARDQAEQTVRLSRTVCTRVLSERTALLSNNLENSELKEVESLVECMVTSLLCVPLRVGNHDGLIYLDSTNPTVRFTENQLHQLTALSFIVSAGLQNAGSIEGLVRENELLRSSAEIETSMIGKSEAIREVFYLISKVAPNDSNVLILGESGTGKELVAKAIHLNSVRRNKPFVAINCAALNESLLESELFGFEKGAFTGATQQKKGKFEAAEGGTVFLDEVGELAPAIQAKLLRVIQEREFERLGGLRPISVDVRLVAATNRKLEEGVKNGTFREDLFFRLNVVQINMPALRERPADIPLLSQYFIRRIGERCNRRVLGMTEKTRRLLQSYHWPGNVRELENVIERAIVLGVSDTILPEDLPSEILEASNEVPEVDGDFHEQVKRAKKRIVNESLQASNGNYTDAARALGLHPNNLHRLMRNLGMKAK